MELYQLDIFPVDYHRADLVITYTLKDETTELDMFKMWISDKEKDNIELLNHANLILYHVIVNNDAIPSQKDLYITYQRLFAYKRWKLYTENKTFINNAKTLTKPPYNKYVEITKDYINKNIDKMYNKYIKENNKK